jgi:hypothetical protein
MLSNVAADTSDKSTYQKWVITEGIPIIREFYIPDIRQVPLEPWERMGGLGVYLNLVGNRKAYGVDESVKSGGDQIDYEDEAPEIHQEFEAALAQAGAPCRMGPHHPLCRARVAG